MNTTKKALKEIAYLPEANLIATGALEKALVANETLTNREINRRKTTAKADLKERFDKLDALIRSLPKRQ
ncbi:MAG: hypothetical protein WBE76_23420 [Terracidiphilus sp.]